MIGKKKMKPRNEWPYDEMGRYTGTKKPMPIGWALLIVVSVFVIAKVVL